jgi:hypothetical protein
MRSRRYLVRFFCLLGGVLVWLNAAAQTPAAGTIGLLKGQASATSAGGAARALSKDGAVYSGEAVQTGAQSYALIKFSDQSTTLLRPSTQMIIEKYQFNRPAAASEAAPAASPLAPVQTADSAGVAGESSFFRLIKGGLRTVSGLIGHADYSHFRLTTPVSTMGIRGTDFVAATCEADCQADPEVLKSVPVGSNTQGAVVSGAYNGTITVTSNTGQVLVLQAGQFAITLADGTEYLLGSEPAFLSTTGAEAGAAGSAAGAETAAESVLIAGSITAGVGAVILGVVISGSSNGGSTGTGTSGTSGTSGR